MTSIGNYVFSGCTNLASVTLSINVTGIGFQAFAACTSLASVTIPNRVTRIEVAAFAGCTSLASASIGSSVTSIGPGAFSGCTSLANVNIPNSVTSIESQAFSGCTNLTSTTIPNSVISIGDQAFSDCTSLATIMVDESNRSYSSLDGVLYNKQRTSLIQYPGGKSGEYMVPNSVISIGDYAFSGCSHLTSVTIPNSVISIGNYAFSDCTSLASVTIPNSVTSIGGFEFSGCTKLRSIYFIGNAPTAQGLLAGFSRLTVTVYYRVGTTGWGSTFYDLPAALWIPEADIDHDGMTNQQEFLTGTDPADAQSLMAFESVARLNDLADEDKTPLPPGQFALHFQSIPGKSYEIQFTETLGAAWSQVTNVTAHTTQKRVVLDRPATNGFYRLKLVAAE